VSAWETNCLVDGEGGPASETGSSGVVVSLKFGLPGIFCCSRRVVVRYEPTTWLEDSLR
jgi:hypothetical protein